MREIIDTTEGAGDSGRAGGQKINRMTAELYQKVADLTEQLTDALERIETLEAGQGTPTPTPSYMMDFRQASNAKYLGAML